MIDEKQLIKAIMIKSDYVPDNEYNSGRQTAYKDVIDIIEGMTRKIGCLSCGKFSTVSEWNRVTENHYGCNAIKIENRNSKIPSNVDVHFICPHYKHEVSAYCLTEVEE